MLKLAKNWAYSPIILMISKVSIFVFETFLDVKHPTEVAFGNRNDATNSQWSGRANKKTIQFVNEQV